MKYSLDEINQKAKQFLNKDVTTIEDAINGARDIIAQRYADDFRTKEVIRNYRFKLWNIRDQKKKNLMNLVFYECCKCKRKKNI